MPDNRSLKEKVLESYNAEKGAFEQNINAKDSNINVSKTFEKKIDDLLGWSFKTKEKKIEEFLDFYQTKLKNYDTDYQEGNKELHGKELAQILVDLRKKLQPVKDKQFDKKGWRELKARFTEYRKKQEGPIKTMNAQVVELTTSIDDIHKCKDKDNDNKRLAEILQRDFDGDESIKKDRETGYTDSFYVNIDKKIKGNKEFEQVGKSIKDRVTHAEKRSDELENKKDQEVIKYFQEMVGANKITHEQVKDFSDEVRLKIVTLLSTETPSQVNDSRRSLVQETINVQEVSALPGGQNAAVPPSVVAHADVAEKAKQEKDILANKVTVGAEVATIGGAALLGAVTIGTGGLFLPIAVGVGTVVAGAIAISQQEEIGKQTEEEKSRSNNEIQKTIQKYVVDNPSEIVTKPVIGFGQNVLTAFGINQAKEDKGRD